MTQPDDLRQRPEEMWRRITKAVSLLSLVEAMPGTGTHGETCTHRDCMAQRVRSILLRGEL